MFTCSECQATSLKWQGRCNNCNNWNTLIEKQIEKKTHSNNTPIKPAVLLNQINIENNSRIKTGILELDNVFGGGIMPASVSILTGDPGVGKSTLALQAANEIQKQNFKVLYFSTEESLSQLKNKLHCFKFLDSDNSNILFSDEYHLENIVQIIALEKPSFCVIDSLQNCFFSKEQNFFGMNNLKETIHEIVSVAKNQNVAILLTGHITKDGSLAGPKVLEHLVDSVFYLQNDEDSHKKILTATKNRFGAIDEIGFFEMNENGLSEILDINKTLFEEASNQPNIGTTLYLSLKGSRYLLFEVQALCIKNRGTMLQRVVSGTDLKKILIITALLEKYLKIELSSFDLFLKIKGGNKTTENASDLALALALISSYLKTPVPKNFIAIGEINLSGKISAPPSIERLLKNSQKLGFEKLITGKTNKIEARDNNVLQVSHVLELLSVFPNK